MAVHVCLADFCPKMFGLPCSSYDCHHVLTILCSNCHAVSLCIERCGTRVSTLLPQHLLAGHFFGPFSWDTGHWAPPTGPYPSPRSQAIPSQGSFFEASCWRHCHLQLFCQALQLAQWVKSTWQRPSGAAMGRFDVRLTSWICRNNTVETCLHRHVLWHQ